MKLLSSLFALFFSLLNWTSAVWGQGCRDLELRKNVTRTAQAEDVDEVELLSIIANESGCRYHGIAWNIPKRTKTAQSKFFNSLENAKAFAEGLIATGRYRVDVGIGQINYEAHIRPKGWTLDEVLNPRTALSRVAKVLKERGWARYHSGNPVYSRKWQALAMAALDRILSGVKERPLSSLRREGIQGRGSLVVFNSFEAKEGVFLQLEHPRPARLFGTSSSKIRSRKADPPWIFFGGL